MPSKKHASLAAVRLKRVISRRRCIEDICCGKYEKSAKYQASWAISAWQTRQARWQRVMAAWRTGGGCRQRCGAARRAHGGINRWRAPGAVVACFPLRRHRGGAGRQACAASLKIIWPGLKERRKSTTKIWAEETYRRKSEENENLGQRRKAKWLWWWNLASVKRTLCAVIIMKAATSKGIENCKDSVYAKWKPAENRNQCDMKNRKQLSCVKKTKIKRNRKLVQYETWK